MSATPTGAQQSFFLSKIIHHQNRHQNQDQNQDQPSSYPTILLHASLEDSTKHLTIAPFTLSQFDDANVFLNAGGSVGSLAFSRNFLAVLAESRVSFWTLGGRECLGFLQVTGAISISWVSHLSSESVAGVLVVLHLDKVELYSVEKVGWENFSENENFEKKKIHFLPFWVSPAEVGFLSCAAARFDGTEIELLLGASKSVVHLVRIGSAHNSSVSESPSTSSSNSYPHSSHPSCVSFLSDSQSPFFLSGYWNGDIALWAVRNARSPVSVTSTLAGIRRWLVDLTPSPSDPKTVFAAYQSGAIVRLGAEVSPIGGDPKSAQCWAVDVVGACVVVAGMSSGVVISLDSSLRDKLRRPMTGYISQWEQKLCGTSRPLDSSTSDLNSRILALLNRKTEGGEVYCEIFPKKKIPTNLKHVRAGDGAGNEPAAPIHINTVPVAVSAVRASEHWVACGTEAGLVHLHRMAC